MRQSLRMLLFGSLVIFMLVTVIIKRRPFPAPSIEQCQTVDSFPRTWPDYSGTVIPPNIAPLNFLILEKGDRFYVKIHADNGLPIEIFSKNSKIIIPLKHWRNLLKENKTRRIHFDIFVGNGNNQWAHFKTFSNTVAKENIDPFLVYRKMHPTHVRFYGELGIYQRDLGTFRESTILDDRHLQKFGCVNCHCFCNNNPDTMVMGIRSPAYGICTSFIKDGQAAKIERKFGYSSWHPSGKLITYSSDDLPMFFHSFGKEVRDTVGLDSMLSYYMVDKQSLQTWPEFSKKDQLETWPTWSADGRYLYFCRSPMLWSSMDDIPPERYREVKYDLMRVNYDITDDQWGPLETVISSIDTNMSLGMPKTSPDGRWLSFCMFDYGFFPTWQNSSDLYLVDLEASRQTGRFEPRPMEINSDESESWHSWSANSRWIVFSSKREHGVFTRLYISYIDDAGKAYKPLLVPQKDPSFYLSCLQSYNTPELITGPVTVTGEKLAGIVRSSSRISINVPVTMATPKVGARPSLIPGQGDRE